MDEDLMNELLNQFGNGNESIPNFIANATISILLSLLLGSFYTKYGTSLSNKAKFSESFVLLSLTTFIIITIVKSSLALSLGLVGALSIVRFRTAIKEPEELVYFFVAIAIGLGLGADQKLITIIGVSIIFIYIFIRNIKAIKKESQQNLIITIQNFNQVNEKDILNVLKKHCKSLGLNRLDESKEITEMSFSVTFDSFDKLLDAKKSLGEIGEIQFSFIDNF